MQEIIVTVLLAFLGGSASFGAGLLWRNGRSERVSAVIGAAICGLDERVRAIECRQSNQTQDDSVK